MIDSGHGRELQDTVKQLLVTLNNTVDTGDLQKGHHATTTEPPYGHAALRQGGDSAVGKGTKRKFELDHAGRFLLHEMTNQRYTSPGVSPPQYDTVSSTTDTETKRQRWERFVAETVPRSGHGDGGFQSNDGLPSPDGARSHGSFPLRPPDQGDAHYVDAHVSGQSPPRELTSFPPEQRLQQDQLTSEAVKRETESPVCHMPAMFDGSGALETSMLNHAIDSATCDPHEFDQYLYPQHDKPTRWQHVDCSGSSQSADAALSPESVDEGAALSPGGEPPFSPSWPTDGVNRKAAPHETPLPCLKLAMEAHRQHIEDHMVLLAAELTGQEPVSGHSSQSRMVRFLSASVRVNNRLNHRFNHICKCNLYRMTTVGQYCDIICSLDKGNTYTKRTPR